MGTLELRNTIIEYAKTADAKLLKVVKAVFESYEKEKEEDFFDQLPKEVQELLLKSREDIKHGNFFTHSEVMAAVKKKYNTAG